MTNLKKGTFAWRPPGRIPLILRCHPYEGRDRETIMDGDCVCLRIGSEQVQINNVKVFSDGNLSGQIQGFEPSQGLEYHGHKIGDIVDFDELHVFDLHLR